MITERSESRLKKDGSWALEFSGTCLVYLHNSIDHHDARHSCRLFAGWDFITPSEHHRSLKYQCIHNALVGQLAAAFWHILAQRTSTSASSPDQNTMCIWCILGVRSWDFQSKPTSTWWWECIFCTSTGLPFCRVMAHQ